MPTETKAEQELLISKDDINWRPKTPITPDQLIEQCVKDGADPDRLAKFLELKIKWDAYNAKIEFDAAFDKFRQSEVVVKATKMVSIATKGGDDITYWHAELDKASDIVEEALRKFGITHTWKPGISIDGKPTMALVLRGFNHTEVMGEMIGPPDTSGSKNAMQAVGSTMKYQARYVMLYSLGIVPKGPDDDGRAATGGLAERAIEEYCIKIKDSNDATEGLKAFQEGWRAADNVNDKPARDRIRKVWETQKKFFAERGDYGKR